MWFPALALGFSCLLTAIPLSASSVEWPHLRGPNLDGVAPTGSVFDGDDFALQLDWRVPLGPAYSGIAVAGGKAVTFYSDGTDDLAVALDSGSGEQVWSYRIDSVYRGRDGSRTPTRWAM